MIPLFADDTVRHNLGVLLDQGEIWVVRGRWARWLDHADPADSVPIATMLPDERLAARAWLRQQRHDIHRTLGHGGRAAPDGWIEGMPLYAALARRARAGTPRGPRQPARA